MSKKLFTAGTGTDVGKTYITALIMKKIKEAGYSVAYYKAAMSGNHRGEGDIIPRDAVFVKECSGISQPLPEMSPYLYEKALSPHQRICYDCIDKEEIMIWYPYSQMKTMKEAYKVPDAQGVYLYIKDQKLIDSVSSWWSTIHGYQHPVLKQVILDQVEKFSHVMLGGLSHKAVEKLSDNWKAFFPRI